MANVDSVPGGSVIHLICLECWQDAHPGSAPPYPLWNDDDAVCAACGRKADGGAVIETEPCGNPRLTDLVTPAARPALHALVHRYGIPSGATVAQQQQARGELHSALTEAYEMGRESMRESVEMACVTPADGCDCSGCSYARERAGCAGAGEEAGR